MRLREIERTDIKDILDIRVSTKENHFSMTDLAIVEVTQESIAEWLEGSVKGWLCEISGKPALASHWRTARQQKCLSLLVTRNMKRGVLARR